MIWLQIVLLVLSIIKELPELIAIFEEIFGRLHGHPLQLAKEHELHTVLSAWQGHRDPQRLKNELQGLKASL